MVRRKSNIIVGLTTFHNEMLQISVPVLSKIRDKFTLIIYNDNPMTTLTKRDIRKYGYCGALYVINTNENIGELRARMEIVEAARGLNPDWFIFCNDSDLLIDVSVPNVSDDNFAVVQNALVIRHRIADLLRAINNPTDIDADGENIELLRPNMGLVGTPIRAKTMFGLCRYLSTITESVCEIDDGLDFYPPFDAIMWNFVNVYAKSVNPNAVPIYMDKINYIKNKIDTARMKYGRLAKPARNVNEHYRRALDKYTALLTAALNAAALRG